VSKTSSGAFLVPVFLYFFDAEAITELRKEVIMISLNVNGKNYRVDVSDDMPLLWVIRDYLNLTGTKFGCGIGECGACTVHIDGRAERSCSIPVR
jgi:xanthine dehydrogenase iron-sulfur cluster and FAD-binding subunit A